MRLKRHASVGGEHGHAVAAFHAKARQGIPEAVNPFMQFAVCVTTVPLHLRHLVGESNDRSLEKHGRGEGCAIGQRLAQEKTPL